MYKWLGFYARLFSESPYLGWTNRRNGQADQSNMDVPCMVYIMIDQSKVDQGFFL